MTQPQPDPDNGGQDPHPRCTWNERRIEYASQLATQTRGAVTAVSSTVEHLRTWAAEFEGRVMSEFGVASTQIRSTDAKLDRLLEGLAIGQVRPVQVSRDWEEGENTAIQDRPVIVTRMKVAEQDRDALAAQVAGLEATLMEQRRNSTRVHDDRRERLRLWGGIAIAFITSGGGVLLLTKLLGG